MTSRFCSGYTFFLLFPDLFFQYFLIFYLANNFIFFPKYFCLSLHQIFQWLKVGNFCKWTQICTKSIIFFWRKTDCLLFYRSVDTNFIVEVLFSRVPCLLMYVSEGTDCWLSQRSVDTNFIAEVPFSRVPYLLMYVFSRNWLLILSICIYTNCYHFSTFQFSWWLLSNSE